MQTVQLYRWQQFGMLMHMTVVWSHWLNCAMNTKHSIDSVWWDTDRGYFWNSTIRWVHRIDCNADWLFAAVYCRSDAETACRQMLDFWPIPIPEYDLIRSLMLASVVWTHPISIRGRCASDNLCWFHSVHADDSTGTYLLRYYFARVNLSDNDKTKLAVMRLKKEKKSINISVHINRWAHLPGRPKLFRELKLMISK